MGKEQAMEAGAASVAGRPWWRLVRRQAGYLAATLLAVASVALALSAVATMIQAGRDEARAADVALVLAPAVPPEALADHVFELFRRGYTPTLILAGEGQAGLQAQLVARGIPEAQVQGADGGAPSELRRLAREALGAGAGSVLVVTRPEGALLTIKIMRDQGLRAYGAPVPPARVEPLAVAEASLRYWQYVLLGL